MAAALPLPSPLRAGLERSAHDLLHPAAAPKVDFTAPFGEPALAPADGVSWRVFKNPVTLFIGGVAAVLLELGEPRVRTGVWEHSSFRRAPLSRLSRTGLAGMVTVYAARSVAERMIAGVVRAHEQVRGLTPDGQPYHANDPALLDWVHGTAAYGFLEAYHAYARPLSDADKARYYAEGAAAARLYGASAQIASKTAVEHLFETMRPRLERSGIVFEFLDIMARTPALPPSLRPLQRPLIRAAAEVLPPWARERLDLGPEHRLRPWERPLVHAAAWGADRALLRNSPAVEACRRLGLPEDYLYR